MTVDETVVDETVVDETVVDETVVDETRVDELGINPLMHRHTPTSLQAPPTQVHTVQDT